MDGFESYFQQDWKKERFLRRVWEVTRDGEDLVRLVNHMREFVVG